MSNPRPCDFYSYWTLQERDWFRLLILQPSPNPDARITCSLLHRPFNESRPYEAVSYTWGDGPAEYPMFVDGGLFRVRRNLYCALRQLRLAHEPRTLWIDAICINQLDIDERGHQVSQMGRIYSKAEEVVIWLGEADDNTDKAMDHIAEIMHAANLASSASPSLDNSFRSWADILAAFLARPDSDVCLTALAVLFTRQWWTRVWTVQEVGMARRATVHCGWKNLP